MGCHQSHQHPGPFYGFRKNSFPSRFMALERLLYNDELDTENIVRQLRKSMFRPVLREWPAIRAMCLAAARGNLRAMRCLVQAGVNLSTESMEKFNMTPLIYAIITHDEECLSYLLGIGVDPNFSIRNLQDGSTPLGEAAIRCSSGRCVRMLINAGVDVNRTSHEGRSALHHAICNRRNVNIQILLDSGADVHNPDCYGITPIQLTIVRHELATFKILQNASSSLLVSHKTLESLEEVIPVFDLEARRRLLRYEYFLNSAKLDPINKYISTSQLAVKHCFEPVICILFSELFGATINPENNMEALFVTIVRTAEFCLYQNKMRFTILAIFRGILESVNFNSTLFRNPEFQFIIMLLRTLLSWLPMDTFVEWISKAALKEYMCNVRVVEWLTLSGYKWIEAEVRELAPFTNYPQLYRKSVPSLQHLSCLKIRSCIDLCFLLDEIHIPDILKDCILLRNTLC